jgi:hypothetical protein
MLKEQLKGITLVTGVLIYFYVCGAIYLIGFWDTFNLDISSFVGLSDVPKSFVFPFIVSNTLFFFGFFVHSRLAKEFDSLEKKKEELEAQLVELGKPAKKPSNKKIKSARVDFLIYFFNLNTFIVIFAILAVNLHSKYHHSMLFWFIATLLFALFLVLKLSKLSLIERFVKTVEIKIYVRYFFILFPVIAFLTGKGQSLRIYNNIEYKTIKTIKSNKIQPVIDSIDLKMLGFLGDRAIVSTLDNKKIVVFSQDIYEGMVLEEVKSTNK